MTEPDEVTAVLYDLVWALPRMSYETLRRELPLDGIYLFFERGEFIERSGRTEGRIVRVGTHRRDGRFPARIRQHYGQVHSLRGNMNGSVFRKHLGAALMRLEDESDPRLDPWLAQGGQSFPEVEESVSRLLRERFAFVCLPVNGREDRLRIESELIALLAQHPLAPPSTGWLGRHAASEEIQRTGLWNTQHVNASPLSPAGLRQLKGLLWAASRGEEW